MPSKTPIGIMAVGLAFMALATATDASASVDDDTLSRMFPHINLVRIEADPHGIGWYDSAATPNVCFITFRDANVNIGGNLYYENFRVWPNLPGWPEPVRFGLHRDPLFRVACPGNSNPLCQPANGCGLQLRPITIGPHVRTIAPQAGLVCNQASAFIDCIVTESYWAVSWCAWANASFDARSGNKGVLAGTGFQSLAFSRDIDCLGSGYRVTQPATQTMVSGFYDVTYLLGSNGNLLSSGERGVTVSLLVPYAKFADETGFVVSCLETEVTEIDSSTAIPVITPGVVEDGKDWFQALDLDALFLGTVQTNWVGDVLVQIGSGHQGNMLAGLPDLGGDNEQDGSDGNFLVGPGDGILCDFAPPPKIPLPQCHDAVDNEATPDQRLDENDAGCFKLDLNLGLSHYDATDNVE